jgi:hypothetical protein
MSRKKILIQAIEEYNLTKEQRAELARLVARITGRKLTGEVVINLGQGSAFGFSTRELVKKTE